LARAQPAERAVKRVGILVTTTKANYQVQEKAIIDAMRELGWVEGRNVLYDRVYADDDETRLPGLAAALVARGPNLIYAIANAQVLAASAKTRAIPIVFASFSRPVELGLIQSLARPGGNVTGVTNIGWELGGKRLQLLKQALPKITRVGVLIQPLMQDSLREQKLIEQAAATLDVRVVPAMIKQVDELDAAFATLSKERVEALLITHISIFLNQRKRILDLAARHRMPVVAHRGELADDGALMAYSSVLTEQIRRSVQLADKILKGANPGDIPVEQPTKFELVVNMKTARALGLTIPQPFMLLVDRVIE
jgi:putative ABC transport system substrate-binding protein